MMKRLIILLEVLSLIFLIVPGGMAQKKLSALVSFSTSSIEFVVDNLSKEYTGYVDVSITTDSTDWEAYCQLDMIGIPGDRILLAQGINPTSSSFIPLTKAAGITRKMNNKNIFLSRINIKYIPSYLDIPGRYEGKLIFGYKTTINGKESLVQLGQLPVSIDIKPIFSVTIWSESEMSRKEIRNGPIGISFRVPKPGEWCSLEKICLTIVTNYSNWNLQCGATDLIDKELNRFIPVNSLYIIVGNSSNCMQFSNAPISILSGQSPGVIGVTLRFKLNVTESILAGEYSGNIKLLFGGM